MVSSCELSSDLLTESPEAATVALWQRFHSELLAYLKGRGVRGAEAEDLLQTVFLRAHRQLNAGEAPHRPRAWLYQILKHLIVDSARRERRQRGLVDQLSDLTPDHGSSEDAELSGEVYRLVSASLPLFVRQLDEPYRSALDWVELQGLTQAEAAQRAGISLSGMKSRVQRGRRQLFAALQRCCEFSLDARGRVVGCSPRSNGSGCGC